MCKPVAIMLFKVRAIANNVAMELAKERVPRPRWSGEVEDLEKIFHNRLSTSACVQYSSATGGGGLNVEALKKNTEKCCATYAA